MENLESDQQIHLEWVLINGTEEAKETTFIFWWFNRRTFSQVKDFMFSGAIVLRFKLQKWEYDTHMLTDCTLVGVIFSSPTLPTFSSLVVEA